MSDDWQAEQDDHRARVASVEARYLERQRREAELWDERYPPCLQKLIADHGTYDLITPEGWAEYDRQMAAFRQHMVHGDFFWKMLLLERSEEWSKT
jgi:alkylation response protein AidB-like acyl-CoA dehydrogenase